MMKPLPSLLLSLLISVALAYPLSSLAQTNTPPSEIDISIKATGSQPGDKKPPPLFFTTSATSTTTLTPTLASTVIQTTLTVLQGEPKVLSIDLDGPGDILAVSGKNLATWSVRQPIAVKKGEEDRRHLDLRPPADTKVKSFPVTITIHQKIEPDTTQLRVPTLAPGKSISFTHHLNVKAPTSTRLTATTKNLTRQGDQTSEHHLQYHAVGPAVLTLNFTPLNQYLRLNTFSNLTLTGALEDDKRSAAMRLTGQVKVPANPDAVSIELLAGDAAMTTIPVFTNAHIRLHPAAGKVPPSYRLHLEPATTTRRIDLDLRFAAKLLRTGDQRSLSFRVPSGTVVPVTLTGVPETVEIDKRLTVVPRFRDGSWQGFLPADGWCRLGWKPERSTAEGSLFFTSTANVDIRVAPGILRQSSSLNLNILQGSMKEIQLSVSGNGEILHVSGPQVVGWKLNGEGDARTLDINLSRPIEGSGTLTITSQTPIGDFPVTAKPLRLAPNDAVRHSGAIRVSNQGAVRLGLTDLQGLTQLAPEQFPGGALPAPTRQVFVYRFPSATHDYTITADAVLPEVGISQITHYELGDTDRIIRSKLELDVREAPIRDLEVKVPAGYSVAEVAGATVADHVLDTDTATLTVVFNGAIEGRQLVTLRLERTAAAEAGDWSLPILSFPSAKTVRGYLGVSATPGFRVTSGPLENLTEIPLSTFPLRDPALQQAYRIRTPDHSGTVVIEALGQHVEVDTFHLYSLKEGAAYGAVLLNYFVVGAPVTQWELEIPRSLGAVNIDGQHVGNWQWTEDSNVVTVDLNQPAMGTHTLLVTFEQPMPSRDSKLVPGLVTPLGVEGETGIIQVTSPQQLEHNWSTVSGNLLELDPLELPAEFQLMSRSPSLGIYQYTERPFQLGLDIQWLEPGQTVEQLVDVADLSSLVSRDGDSVTTARYFVKTRGRKSLRVKLPKALDLWEVRVANKTVSPRANEGETIIPLPPNVDPNTAVDVTLRFGTKAYSESKPRLQAPRLSPSTLFARWHVETEPGHHLDVKGGATVLHEVLPRRGFGTVQELIRRGGWIFVTLLALLIGAILRFFRNRFLRFCAACLVLLGLIGCLVTGVQAVDLKQSALNKVEAVSSIITEGQLFELPARHLTTAQVSWSTFGVLLILLGVLAILVSFFKDGYTTLLRVAGIVLIGLGLLHQRGGAPLFFWALAALLFVLVVWRDLFHAGKWVIAHGKSAGRRVRGKKRNIDPGIPPPAGNDPDPDPEPPSTPGGPATSAATALLLLAGFAFGPGVGEARAAEAPPSADRIQQTATIEDNRLYSEVTFQVTGKAGTAIPLLSAPAVLASFDADGLAVHQSAKGQYLVVIDTEGTHSGKASYELPIPDLVAGFNLPTGPATVNLLDLQTAEAGFEFASAMAVSIDQAEGDESGASFVLGPKHPAKIDIRPRARDLDAEDTRIFAEVANLYTPGPGVVDASHRVSIRPSQGRVSKLAFTMPEGFTVSDVSGPIGLWQFDPEARTLRVNIEPAQSAAFDVVVQAQRGMDALPATVELLPLRVQEAAGEVGMTAIAFGNNARAQSVESEGLSAVNLEDFDQKLLMANTTLRRVFRYSGPGEVPPLTVTVGPVLPEVRAIWAQQLSIADERTVLAATLNAQILRAGIFRLNLPIPAEFEVETVSGGALAQWSEVEEDGENLLRLDLTGRTLGNQAFAVTLVSTGIGSRASWEVPRLSVKEASRQTGTLTIAPEQGIRLRPIERANVSLLPQSGVHAFKLLQADWRLVLAVEKLDPWITAQALHEITLREGRTHTRIGVNFDVENATVKTLRLQLDDLAPEERDSVRASGDALQTIVKVPDENNTWELQFRRRMIGNVPVVIEYHRNVSATNALETLSLIRLPEVRQLESHFAVHTSGRLDPRLPEELPAGWRRADWTTVPPALRQNARNFTPAICLRVAEPEGPLDVRVVRDKLAEILKLRVVRSQLNTVFSHTGNAITSVDMDIHVVEKSTLRVQLPDGATLYNAFVNGESVSIIREGDAFLFHVVANPFNEGPARVSFVYSLPGRERTISKLDLVAPRLEIPLVNMTWQVVVPEGMRLVEHDGDLDLKRTRRVQVSNLATYLAQLRARDAQRSANAKSMLTTANQYLQKGERERALRMLDNIASSKELDAASNEDARIQLRELQTEQTWSGLITRRQRILRDRPEVVAKAPDGGARLEEAIRRNPLFRGNLNYRPDELNVFLSTNTAEENSALRRLARRLTSHQLRAAPAAQAIAFDLPRQGMQYEFSRHVQVKGNLPMELELDLKPARRSHKGFIFLIALGLAILGGLLLVRRREEPAKVATETAA